MPERSLFSDILSRIAGSSRRTKDTTEKPLAALCDDLLAEQGEASVLTRAQAVLARLATASLDEKTAFFEQISATFGPDEQALDAAISAWQKGDVASARALHFAAEPQSQNLIRALNSVPGATAQLVNLRADLLALSREKPALKGLDQDFQHLFASWFNRGFLEIRRISWETPAHILEKIIAYEAVHEITGWDDLRQRVGDPDRRLFAFFHPAMPSEPLIFVEVALTETIPSAIAPILSNTRKRITADEASVAVFYSISNCQKGLRGISFGNFLIKQVVAELQRELPELTSFVTLSPVPALRTWAKNNAAALDAETAATLAALAPEDRPTPELAAALAATYLTKAKRGSGHTAFDPVAHFHLGNGAELHAIHPEADLSARGLSNSWGVMVNYLYDGSKIEERHSAYAAKGTVAASKSVKALAAEPKTA